MTIVFLALLLAASSTAAQQVRDTSFRFENTNPAFSATAGPVVCIDEAHNNFHTADGRYWAFAELLREDGYRVEGFGRRFDSKGLLDCNILVSANPGEVGMDDAYPHPSAFTRDDMSVGYSDANIAAMKSDPMTRSERLGCAIRGASSWRIE